MVASVGQRRFDFAWEGDNKVAGYGIGSIESGYLRRGLQARLCDTLRRYRNVRQVAKAPMHVDLG